MCSTRQENTSSPLAWRGESDGGLVGPCRLGCHLEIKCWLVGCGRKSREEKMDERDRKEK